MKTAEEIMKEVFGITAYNEVPYKPLIRDAMKLYASQAIDKCADEAEIKTGGGLGKANTIHVVGCDSILRVKELLK